MAKLKKLINGQNISFDAHQAGDGQELKWKELAGSKLAGSEV